MDELHNILRSIMILLLILLLPSFAAAQQTDAGAAKAIAFIKMLSEQEKKITVFPFGDSSRFDWHFVPASTVQRTGIAVKDLSETQQAALYALLENYLSSKGYNRTKTIMSFEYLLKELEPNNPTRIPENYFAAVYGNPGDSIWGWKFSGHHIALNFTIINNQLAFAPFFFGANPGEVKTGPQKGLRVMKEEEDIGFELVNSLSEQQKKTAIFQLEAFSEIVTGNSTKVNRLTDAGILSSELTKQQLSILNKLIVTYLTTMPADIANSRMKKIIEEDADSLRFGWAGGTVTGKPHYYRIQGKSFLIEFDNTQNNANHIHTVWRDFDGDYGRDLLQEHYQNSKHHK